MQWGGGRGGEIFHKAISQMRFHKTATDVGGEAKEASYLLTCSVELQRKEEMVTTSHRKQNLLDKSRACQQPKIAEGRDTLFSCR